MKKLMFTLGAVVAAALAAQAQEAPEAVEAVEPETAVVEQAEVAAPVEVAEPVAEPVETVETVEPAAEPVAETVEPVAEPVEAVEPVAETVEPVAEPVEAVEPVAETVEPVAEPVEAEPEDKAANFLELSLTLDVNSAYVSHNRIFSDTAVAQYDIWMQINLPECFGWVAVDVWASQELNKNHSSREGYNNGGKQFGGIGEFDYEIVYGNSIGPVNLTTSHLWYTYPRTGWGSQNFWTAGAEYENEIVVPSVKFYWEYCHNNKPDAAFMIDFALSRGFDITDRLSLKLVTKTTLYTAEYVEYLSDGALNKAAFGGWDNGISLNYALTDNLSLGAHLNYLYKLDHRVRHCPGWDNYSVDNPKGSHDGLLYGGVSANLAF